MGTVNPRMRGDASLRGTLGQAQDDREQIRRLLSAQKKPKPPTPGGIVGVAEVLSQAGTVSVSIDGLNADSVRYSAPTDPFAADTPLDWLGFDSANPSRITLAKGGWYSALLGFTLEWNTASEAPSDFNPIIYFGGAGFDWDTLWVPGSTPNIAQGGYKGLHHILDIGPIYAQDAFTVLQAQMRQANATGTSLKYGIIAWKITKWS